MNDSLLETLKGSSFCRKQKIVPMA
uniref:Uncharacterized protein n=1 Tax=Arundo donax TaxID=35708 RepID=A0A0A8ZDA8_ARUDO